MKFGFRSSCFFLPFSVLLNSIFSLQGKRCEVGKTNSCVSDVLYRFKSIFNEELSLFYWYVKPGIWKNVPILTHGSVCFLLEKLQCLAFWADLSPIITAFQLNSDAQFNQRPQILDCLQLLALVYLLTVNNFHMAANPSD